MKGCQVAWVLNSTAGEKMATTKIALILPDGSTNQK